MRLKCAACGAFAIGSATWCAACGVDGAMFPVGRHADAPEAAPASLAEAGREAFWKARGELGKALGGKVSPSALVLLSGEPGSGKSTLAIRLLLDLGRSAMHLDGEMSAEQCRSYYQRAGASDEALRAIPRVGAVGWAEAIELVRTASPDVVLVDSLQAYAPHNRARGAFVAELRALRSFVLLISQVNAQGNPVGGTGPEHAGDASVWVTARRISVVKCRWAPSCNVPRSESSEEEEQSAEPGDRGAAS